MAHQPEITASVFGVNLRAQTARLICAAVLAVVAASGSIAQAQTYTVLHTFTGGQDGAAPLYSLTMDGGGNLYGTAENGGIGQGENGYGSIYRLKHSSGGWVLDPLYAFSEFSANGKNPRAGLVFGPGGALYGTTVFGSAGGCIGGCGVVYELQPPVTPPRTPLTPWNVSPLYNFNFYNDAHAPAAEVTFDQAGNMYGTTFTAGAIYELQFYDGSWHESVLHFCYFNDPNNCYQIVAPVTLDSAGNLYGVSLGGGPGNWGIVFELSPYGTGWLFQIIYAFQNNGDGNGPAGGLIFDGQGNLWGTASGGGSGNGGTVFELSPYNGSWTFHLVYSFTGNDGPEDKLLMDAAGNLYGTTYEDGAYGYGNVFELSPSDGGWTYTSLYDFTNANDGRHPIAGVVMDGNGNLYGTANGGAQNSGVIYEITR